MQPFKPFHISFFRFFIVLVLALVLAGAFYYWLYMKVPEVSLDSSLLNTQKTTQKSVDLPKDSPGLESTYVAPSEDTKEDEDKKDSEAEVEVKTMNSDMLLSHIIQKSGLHIMDLRGQVAFDAGRIRYSKLYDSDDFKESDFTTTGSYLLVCDSGVCDAAKEIVQKLGKKKVNIKVLEGGYAGWIADGFKILKKGEEDTVAPPTQTSVSTGDSNASGTPVTSTSNETTSGTEEGN